jgi:hypothetical protein
MVRSGTRRADEIARREVSALRALARVRRLASLQAFRERLQRRARKSAPDAAANAPAE